MTIELKKCLTEKNHLTREFETGEGATATHTGTLRGLASLTDPVIQIPATADIAGFNYCEIPAFERKYFITDIPVIVNGMWELHMHVDVIGTWLTEIKEAEAMAQDREDAPNLYVDHNLILSDDQTITSVLPFKKVVHKPFYTRKDDSSLDPPEDDDRACLNPNGWTKILIVAGPGPIVEPEPEPEPTP